MSKVRPYLFYDATTSVCTTCLRRCEAKVLIQENRVFLEKWCPLHGKEKVLISDDADYYRLCREKFIKEPERPLRFNTPLRYGCPYDCGICPDHMQHGCLTLVEITDHCNLQCPVCFAESGPHRSGYRDLDTVIGMLDAVVANEGEPDVVQISGGEPTLHPDFFEILAEVRKRPIRHLMVNTNGISIAKEPAFAARLAEFMPGFEIYLQFDGLDDAVNQELRAGNLHQLRLKALENLNQHGISTTLVATLKRGLNDHQIGAIIEFAKDWDNVRGVTFQPIQEAGRTQGFQPEKDRLTLSEVRRGIYEQSPHFNAEDILPVPCNPDCLAMGYALKSKGKLIPLTGMVPAETLLQGTRNTIVMEQEKALRQEVFKLFATNHGPKGAAGALKALLCCLPKIKAPEEITYKNIFRVIIMQFQDARGYDLRAVKKSCVHIVQSDGTMIPFDTHNIFYRDDKKEILQVRRRELDQFYGREPVAGS